MKIALCIWMFKPGTGGLQAHAAHLAKHLIARGHEVTVITRAYTCVPERLEFLTFEESEAEALVEGIPVRAIHYSNGINRTAKVIAKLRDYPGLWRFSIALFRRYTRSTLESFKGFDCIHYVGQADQLFGFATADAAKYHDIPFTVQPTCHPFEVGDSPMDVALYNMARKALVHTHYEADHLRPMMPNTPFEIVGNGIEDRSDGNGERFRAQYSVSGPMILYIGRRSTDKGYALVVAAFKLLYQIMPDVTLVCMGPSGGLPMDESAGIVNFEFAPEQVKHDALAACTCLCVPSEGESFGLVYMEAGRYAKPVVARRLPVLEELLDGGNAGFLVGNLDRETNKNELSAETLMETLIEIIENPAKARSVGIACRKVSETFIWSQIVRRFETAFSS